MFTPELLSPAGSLKNMRYAFAYGADAVYAGQPRYSLRVRNNEFNHENLKIGINEAHSLGKKFYVVVNIQPHNAKLKTFIRDITPVIEMQPDALIMSDPGLIMMVRQNFPDMPIHLSVQANAVNWASVKFWQDYGIQRVILSRELSLEEIAQIREHCPTIELEVFVHGALCMAYSGRCLLSGYFNKRDPNQGACTNSCRWQYKVHEGTEDDTGQIIKPDTLEAQKLELQELETQNGVNQFSSLDGSVAPAPTLGLGTTYDKPVLLEELNRPGEYMSAYEDEHGTYIMNSKDLRAVQYVERLTQMGVHSLKIEGRTKSFYYVARTAQVYRKAIDDAVAGKPFDITLMGTLENLAHRGYTEGFLKRHVHDEYQNYEAGYSVSTQQQLVGEVISQSDNLVEIAVKNKFLVGNSLELMTPNGNINFVLDNMQNADGDAMDVAPGGGHIVYIKIADDIDASYGILMRNLGDNESTLNPHSTSKTQAPVKTIHKTVSVISPNLGR